MNDITKIYTLYFALDRAISDLSETLPEVNRDRLFQQFWNNADHKYSDLHYDLVCEMGMAHTRATEEFGRIESGIERALGKFESNSYRSIICRLWFAFNAAIVEYCSIDTISNPKNFYDEIEQKLKLGSEKYLSRARSSIEEWNSIDAIVKSRLGDF